MFVVPEKLYNSAGDEVEVVKCLVVMGVESERAIVGVVWCSVCVVTDGCAE